jgi:hypothetical protein
LSHRSDVDYYLSYCLILDEMNERHGTYTHSSARASFRP